MKKAAFLFLAIILILSCNSDYIPRATLNISINDFKIDSSSIRAIEVFNDSTLIYAGSIGDIGFISNTGTLIKSKKIKTDSIVPHFRTIAFTNEAIYALNVENPALLYQYKKDSLKIVYKEEHKSVFYNSMKFFDDLNGIAMGDPTDGCISVLITRDGGNTWRKIDCEDLPKTVKGEAAFAASNTNIAIFKNNVWIVTGGIKARVLHSEDKGVTWSLYETPIVQGKNTTGIYSVDFYDENNGIICGGDFLNKFGNSANKAITTDGGKTWKVIAKNMLPKYVSCVQYIPNTNGKEVVAVSTNGIFYSKNAGENWEKISDKGYYSVRFVNENLAWLSGHQVIAKMTIN